MMVFDLLLYGCLFFYENYKLGKILIIVLSNYLFNDDLGFYMNSEDVYVGCIVVLIKKFKFY